MGLLRGDDLVADYLVRLGAAAADLPAPDRTWLVEAARRRIRERAGGPGTRNEALVEVVLRELGEPENVVAARGWESHGAEIEAADPEADPERQVAPTGPDAPDVALAGAHDPDRTSPFPPLFADPDLHLVLPADLGSVRPAPAHVDAGPDLLTSLGGVRLELAALVALAAGPSVLGALGFVIAIAIVVTSRFWTVRDKVAVTVGFSLAGLLLSVVAAWLSATRLQESDDPGTRISTAGHSLAHSMHTLPAGIGWVGALYLGWVLVRDLSEHGRH